MQVKADGGMLGEKHDKEHDASQAAQQHQKQVEAPIDGFVDSLHDKDNQRNDQQNDGTRARAQREAFLHGLHTRLHHRELVDDQWRFVGAVVGDKHLVDVVHQVGRQKLLLIVRGRTVGFQSQQDVVAELKPRMVGATSANHLAEGLFIRIGFAYNLVLLVLQMLENDVACPCSTIIIEVIVAVDAVLGLVVFVERSHDALFLLAVQIDHLLGDFAAVATILGTEIRERHHAHLVVGESEDKAQHKVRLGEAEHAVVDGQVHSPGGILDSNGRVAIQTIDFLMRRACEQADAHAVEFLV